ncbi:MAG: hypothetical protein Q9162_003017 [Coniocarpon cinnabarinum]
MSFFGFKSKNKQQPGGPGLPPASRNLTSSDGSTVNQQGSVSSLRDASNPSRTGAGSSMGNSSNLIARGATPDQSNVPPQMRNATSPPQRPPPDMSLYPWSQRSLTFSQPSSGVFPRYGAAANAVASPKGEIYMMGGLINGTMVKGDLWTIEASPTSATCNPVFAMAEGPGPRVGHAALLVGNAFIVFGGDTKVDELDVLDDTLYLLNTSTKHWSRALPAGQRPAGRYGHTLNILGSKIYIFGGQVEGYFFNDLVAFDLNALQQSSNKWEILIHNTSEGGPSQGPVPPARTNHSVVTWNNKLFLFGGTDGMHWYNDVWSFDPSTNSWTMQECIGFIPTAREGHAAALVGDVMYVFGGRTEEGRDLGDLAAFRIPTKRWYTFQNMGPSPSPRSGHSLTAAGEKIFVVGGEPSSAPRDANELSLAYVLDTSKIRYPPDSSQPNGVKTSSRRPSIGDRSQTPSQERAGSSQGQYVNGAPRWTTRNASEDSVTEPQPAARGRQDSFPEGNTGLQPGPQYATGRGPRSSPAGPPAGPPPGGPPPNIPLQQQQQQPQASLPPPQPSNERVIPQMRANGAGRPPFAGITEREQPQPLQRTESPQTNGVIPSIRGTAAASRRPQSPPGSFPHSPPRQPVESSSRVSPSPQASQPTMNSMTSQPPIIPQEPGPRLKRQQDSTDSTPARDVPQSIDDNYTLKAVPEPQRGRSVSAAGPQPPIDSAMGSLGTSPALNHQNDALLKELEAQRSKNAWYASELSMARKAGYQSANTTGSPYREEHESIDEDDKPLMETLFKMRAELVKVQEALAKQRTDAADQIASVEQQRDAAVSEAVYHKTRAAGRAGKDEGLDLSGPGSEREQDSARRLAIALSSQAELQSRIHALVAEIDAERRARQIAEESADSAHSRASELDSHKQASTSELEHLRGELHEAEKALRQISSEATNHQATAKSLQVDKNELTGKLAMMTDQSRDHDSILSSLREAVTASTEKASMLEKKLEHERRERSSLEEKLTQVKAAHESSVSELQNTTRRLQDAEELANSHASEAKTHREALMTGFGRVSDRSVRDSDIQDERVEALRAQVESAEAMARRNQDAADSAAEKLRKAEERIAGLEAYQEQASREGLGMRKQLQAQSREAVALHSEKADLQKQLSTIKMDGTALQVQHSTLRDVLAERGIDPSSSPRSRGLVGDDARFKELESQLEAQAQAHEEMRKSFEKREYDANRGWEEKLAALDSDYQAAVKYLKGTEKMLSKMKTELQRYKTANKELEDQVKAGSRDSSAAATPTPPPAWEMERNKLRNDLEAMSQRISSSQQQLEQQMAEVRAAHAEREMAQQTLAASQQRSESELASLKETNEKLEKRAREAERKVQTLLDTVGTSVDNYRSSRSINGLHPEESNHAKGHYRGNSASSLGADSNYSNPAEPQTIGDRNSMALDSLASELETLRSHWETTNKNYRSSQQSMNVPTPMTPGGHLTNEGESLANWRRKLDLREREESAGRESTGTA